MVMRLFSTLLRLHRLYDLPCKHDYAVTVMSLTVVRYRISVTGNRRVCMVSPEYRIMGIRGIVYSVTLFDGNTVNIHRKTFPLSR